MFVILTADEAIKNKSPVPLSLITELPVSWNISKSLLAPKSALTLSPKKASFENTFFSVLPSSVKYAVVPPEPLSVENIISLSSALLNICKLPSSFCI